MWGWDTDLCSGERTHSGFWSRKGEVHGSFQELWHHSVELWHHYALCMRPATAVSILCDAQTLWCLRAGGFVWPGEVGGGEAIKKVDVVISALGHECPKKLADQVNIIYAIKQAGTVKVYARNFSLSKKKRCLFLDILVCGMIIIHTCFLVNYFYLVWWVLSYQSMQIIRNSS